MNDWQKQMFKELSRYYDSNLMANIMAPMFPDAARNTLWILKRKPGDIKVPKNSKPASIDPNPGDIDDLL